jgi:CMP-N-acetylneuraminic acid synthetase
MVCYTIEAAIESSIFADIYVSTEDSEIAKISNNCGVKVINRPKQLSTDLSTVVDVCLHAVDYLKEKGKEYDILCVLLATSPLRSSEDIINAYNIFTSQKDSGFLMAVTDYLYDPFIALKEVDGYLEPVFPEYTKKKRQELPRVFVDNGVIYIMKISNFLKLRTFYGPKLLKYYMPFERSIDVDTEIEFKLAEYFMEKRQ